MNPNELLKAGVFVNRSLMDWYYTKEFKGGVVDLLFDHPNPLRRASMLRWNDENDLINKINT